MTYDIREVDNETAKEFLRDNHAKDENVFVRDYDVWYGSFVDGKLVCVNGAIDEGCYVKTGSLFTLPEYRKRGHAVAVKEKLLENFKGRYIKTFSRPAAAELEEKYFGFKRGREFPNGTVIMTRDGVKGKAKAKKDPVDMSAIRKQVEEWRDLL